MFKLTTDKVGKKCVAEWKNSILDRMHEKDDYLTGILFLLFMFLVSVLWHQESLYIITEY